MAVICVQCGKEIRGDVVRPEEWGSQPFCSWDCVEIYAKTPVPPLPKREYTFD